MIQLIKDTDLGYAKDVDAEKFEGKRRKGQQRMSWLDGITDSMDKRLSRLLEILAGRGVCAAARGVAQSQARLSH